MPTFDLAYGKERVRIDVPSDDSDGVSEETPPPRISLRRAFDEAWNCPIEMGGPAELIEPGERVVVVITDHTRPTPTREVFPLLWEKINRRVAVEDVTLLVATGTHRASTDEELESMLGELRDEFWVIVHDCDRDTVEIGTTTLGTPIALRATIEANHARLTDPRSTACVYGGNPINEEMVEAAQRVGLDFIVDVVLSSTGEVAKVVVGEPEAAHAVGRAFWDEHFQVPFCEPYDVVIASAGGHPKDINLYQAYKAQYNAMKAVRDGGILYLIAACPNGIGHPVFTDWIERSGTPEGVFAVYEQEGFRLGGHKAVYHAQDLRRATIYLRSELDDGTIRRFFMEPVRDMADVLEEAERRFGDDCRVLVMPHAADTFPVCRET